MLLGEPEQPPSTEVSEDKDSNNPLRVNAKHINVEYELLRLFGPSEEDERRFYYFIERILVLHL